jgi:ABC-2 type transport system permease protein
MPQAYNQSRALWAITKASYKAIFSNPSAIVFSILFPIIFIMIFGAFGNAGVTRHRIALAADSDTNNIVFDSLRSNPFVRIVRYNDTTGMRADLEKGKLAGIISIHPFKDSTGQTRYFINVRSTSASGAGFGAFLQTLQNITLKIERGITGGREERFIVKPEVYAVKQYRQIDFILPGQLGFSILFSTLFGIAFTFFGLREQLVLKRFYASPVNRINILLGIGMSRLFFQLMNVIVLILVGHFFMNFTLQHGAITVIEILVMTIVMLFLLMGVGLIISSIVKSDTSIPLLINLFGFPQMLLSGTFFTIEVFPKWLQQICAILPLTQYNDAIRKISFEGLHLFDCWKQLGILGIWIIIVYFAAVRVLKWE